MRPLALAAMLACASPASAAFSRADAGTAGGQFLKMGTDARSMSMGGAVRAHLEDASAAHWNPAGLAGLRHRHATLTHAALYQGVFSDFIAYAQPVETLVGGASPRQLHANQMGTVALYALYLNAGRVAEIDNTGLATGQGFTPQDLAVGAAWGAALERDLDIGIGVKYISSKLRRSATTGAADLGVRYRLRVGDRPWTLALAVQNVGGSLRYSEESTPLPTTVAIAQSFRLTKKISLTADLVAPRDNAIYPAFGAEFRLPLDPDMALSWRIGYDGRNGSGLEGLSRIAVGGGLNLSRFGFDYAWAPYGLLGDAHRLSLSYRF